MITVINNSTIYDNILTAGRFFYFCDDENKELCISTHDGYINLVSLFHYLETPDVRKRHVKIIDDNNITITWRE